jgi:hypothetical protein
MPIDPNPDIMPTYEGDPDWGKFEPEDGEKPINPSNSGWVFFAVIAIIGILGVVTYCFCCRKESAPRTASYVYKTYEKVPGNNH